MTVLIILNEKEFAERCINEHRVLDKPFLVLTILAKYYYHHLGYRKKEINTLLIEFMEQNYPYYSNNKLDWDSNIERIVKNVNQYTLHEIDGVWITQAEIDVIRNINNRLLERLAFTFLCLAKLGNAKNENNNGWVNVDNKEIFMMAHIICKIQDRNVQIGKLCKLGLLELPKRNDNLDCRVTFVNDESEKVLFVFDFRELGYEYLKYQGENYIRCAKCGILTKGNDNGTKKYCHPCTRYKPLKKKQRICIDCGKIIEISSKNNKSIRCDACQEIADRESKRLWKEKNSII